MKTVTLAVLTLSYFIYLSIGAAIFSTLEKPEENRACIEAHEFLAELRNQSGRILSISQINDFAHVSFYLFVFYAF